MASERTSPIVIAVAATCVAAVAGVAWWALGTSASTTGGEDGRSGARGEAAAPAEADLLGGSSDATDAGSYAMGEPSPESEPEAESDEETERRRVAARAPVPAPPEPANDDEFVVDDIAIDHAVLDVQLDPAAAAQRVADVEGLYGGLRSVELGALSEDVAIAELEAYVVDIDAAAADLLGAAHDDPRVEVRGYVALARAYERLELLTAEQIGLSDRDEVTERLAGTHGQTAARLYELAVRSADTTGVEVPGLDDARAFVAEQEASAEYDPEGTAE